MGPKNKNTRGASNTPQDVPRTSQVVTIEDELDESIRQLDDHLKEVGVGSDSRKAVCEAQMTRNLNLVKKSLKVLLLSRNKSLSSKSTTPSWRLESKP